MIQRLICTMVGRNIMVATMVDANVDTMVGTMVGTTVDNNG